MAISPSQRLSGRFSPCGMARIAHVQGLRGCLYTLRCFHIPTYRFHGTVRACNSPKVTTSLPEVGLGVFWGYA